MSEASPEMALSVVSRCTNMPGIGSPSAWWRNFSLLDASTYSSVPKSKLHVVSTSPEDAVPLPGVPLVVAPFACNWETELEDLITPKPVLERISECLTKS